MPDKFNFSEAFNSQTLRGRANVSDFIYLLESLSEYRILSQVAKATWISVGVIYLMVKMNRNNTKRDDAKLYCKGCQQVMLTG